MEVAAAAAAAVAVVTSASPSQTCPVLVCSSRSLTPSEPPNFADRPFAGLLFSEQHHSRIREVKPERGP